MAKIKIISVNIEGAKHLALITAFLKSLNPDVILLQEVFDEDLEILANEFAMKSRFCPMWQKERQDGAGEKLLLWGMGFLTALPIVNESVDFYSGSAQDIPVFDRSKIEECCKAVLRCKVKKNGRLFNFCNTHFTWTPDGLPTPLQFKDLDRLLAILAKFKDLILCGDFNAPRGGPIWTKIAQKYQDNIPEDIISTIDSSLHRKNFLKLVVDGLFTTKGYRVEDIEIVDGLSDHCAITAQIQSTWGVD